MNLIYNEEVRQARAENKPVVALESTVIAHGLPFPNNIETAKNLEKIVRDSGAIPATIAVLGGDFCVGLDDRQLEKIAADKAIRKISRRDLPIAAAKKLNCATTVATTSFIAYRAGIKVFATGGIGGVHRGAANDVSADLPELAQTPLVVVCSGAKIVLDLPATREWLETHGITILGWQSDEMPAFYSRKSGLPVDERVDAAAEVAAIASARDNLNLRNAILLTVPVPKKFEINANEIEQILAEILVRAEEKQHSRQRNHAFFVIEIIRKKRGQNSCREHRAARKQRRRRRTRRRRNLLINYARQKLFSCGFF